jgi:PhzF family phenazine biosynthesis protein
MKIKIFQVDAFADQLFKGNPAAVCPLEAWLPDELMQKIAFENNLSETAFFVKEGNEYHIRWFTPKTEVDLCGHATLASAHVLYRHLGYDKEILFLKSKSGDLRVRKNEDMLVLDFPAGFQQPCSLPNHLVEALGAKPIETGHAMDFLLAVFDNEETVVNMKPDFKKLMNIPFHAVIVTAKGKHVDFVSRMFAPAVGIDEDPVTGSAHTVLTPFWSQRLNKIHLTAKQVSERGGELSCKMSGDRVEIGGKAITFLVGEIEV